MKVLEITVGAGRTFNHPFEQYSNMKPSISLKATLDDGEDWKEAAKSLQAQAESEIEDHKQAMLRSIKDLYDMTIAEREMSDLGEALRQAKVRMDALRQKYPNLPGLITEQEDA